MENNKHQKLIENINIKQNSCGDTPARRNRKYANTNGVSVRKFFKNVFQYKNKTYGNQKRLKGIKKVKNVFLTLKNDDLLAH